MRLQDVVHHRRGPGSLAAAVDIGDDRRPLAAGRKSRPEAADPILDRGDRGLVDDRDRTDSARERSAHELARLSAALHVVARDVRDDLAVLGRAGDIGREHRDPGLVGLDDRAADRLRIVRGQDDRRDLLRDEILDLTLLFGIVARGVDDGDGVSVLGRFGLHSGLHVLVELRFSILHREPDRLAARRCRSACRGARTARRCGGRGGRRVRRFGAAGENNREGARENERLLHTVESDAGSVRGTPAKGLSTSELPRT